MCIRDRLIINPDQDHGLIMGTPLYKYKEDYIGGYDISECKDRLENPCFVDKNVAIYIRIPDGEGNLNKYYLSSRAELLPHIQDVYAG